MWYHRYKSADHGCKLAYVHLEWGSDTKAKIIGYHQPLFAMVETPPATNYWAIGNIKLYYSGLKAWRLCLVPIDSKW